MANTPCPGPLDYGDLVVAPDGRIGEINGWGRPPLEYRVAFTYDATRWCGLSVDDGWYGPHQLEKVGHFDRSAALDECWGSEAQ